MNTDTGIYSITSPSGKQYIGSARSFEARWATHRHHLRAGTHHSPALQRAWDKYGEKNMIFAKIALCPVTDLLIVEQSRIISAKPAYNVCAIAGSQLGMKHSADARKKISDAKKGENHQNWGKNIPPETRERISRAQRGENGHWWGKSPSAQSRSRMSSAKMGKIYDASARANMALSKMGAQNPAARAVVCVETNVRFVTGAAAAEWLRSIGFQNSTRAHISATASGKRKSAYGYTWRFAD
jgi:group I intron endonuclease